MIPSWHCRRPVRGLSLIGLLFWAVVTAVVAVLIMKIAPTVGEYLTIQKTVIQIAKESNSAAEVRSAFEKHKQIEYSITSIGGPDLVVDKQGDKLVVSFAYDKEIALIGPVFLLIKYQGRSK